MMKLYLFIIATFAALDQFSKAWARHVLTEYPYTLELTSFLNLTPSWNRGVSFGIFNQESPFVHYGLIALTSTIILVLFFWLIKKSEGLLSLALSCIIGGALGNLIDRFTFGAVFDFIDVHSFGIHFWTFNVADACVTLGAILILVDMVKEEYKRKKTIS